MQNKHKKIESNLIKHKALSLSFAVLASSLFVSRAFASPISTDNVLYSINQERTSRGLQKLTIDPDLTSAASLKSKDMLNRNYFEHFAFGLSPWDFIHNAGYNYLYAGENLAMDFNTSEGMVSAWMNSPAHRDNILNPDFRETGIGIIKGEFSEDGKARTTTMVTDMFGREKPTIVKAFDYITKNLFRNLF
jgi:uncharacterized protein YkwD